jgi:murein DD-endopeptidase MepM/ murein hydrolase activator NlpD
MLERAGVGGADAGRAAALVSAVLPLTSIEPGTQFDITLGRRAAADSARSLDRLAFRARFDLDLAIARDDSGLTVSRRPIAVDSTPLRITGTVGTSLYRSARAAGAPAKAIQQYLQALDSHIGLDEGIAPDDTFDLVLSYRRSAGGEAKAGDLVYAGLEHGGKPRVQLLRWDKDGQFVSAPGIGQQQQSISIGGSFAPVAGHLTSGFGMRRHPILGYVRMHSGVDFGAPWGSPIFAASAGVVSFAGRHGGHGNYVRLEHGGGLGTGYAHMSRIAVSPGMHVAGGQVIGYVGSSGLSTGPHLHYEAYLGGQKVNPLGISFSGLRAVAAAPVDTRERDEFAKRLAAIRAIEPGRALQRLGPR